MFCINFAKDQVEVKAVGDDKKIKIFKNKIP